MASKRQSPYRIYLVLDPFRDALPGLSQAVKPLEDVASYLPGVEAFYDPKSNAALFGLQFDRKAAERIGPDPLIQLVAECGLPVIAPEELSEEEYISFFARHLPGYPVQVRHLAGNTGDSSLVQQLARSLQLEADKAEAEARVAEARMAQGTDGHETVQIAADMPSLSPRSRPARPSSRWELDLDDLGDDDDELIEIVTSDPDPDNDWELIL